MVLLEALTDVFVGRLADLAADGLKQLGTGKEPGVGRVETNQVRECYIEHVQMVTAWASQISFNELRKAKILNESFVDLDLLLGSPRAQGEVYQHPRFRVSEVHSQNQNYVILGDPGAGKTTSLKKIALNLLEKAGRSGSPMPLVVRLREFPNATSLTEMIRDILGLVIYPEPTIDATQVRLIERRVILKYMANFAFTILVDGLDEVKLSVRTEIVRDLQEFLLRSGRSHYIITCRTGDYLYNLENSTVLALRPLSSHQIKEFTQRWLGADRAPDFVSKIARTPYSGSEVRPLTLAHLCAIYERSGTIPEKPRTVYRKIIRLMLEEWDEQRGIRRESRYADFEVDRKEEFLEAIAYHLTLTVSTSRFSHQELSAAYDAVYRGFGLPDFQAHKVVAEIESHTGLLLETSYGMYEFAHKSLQEYLTATYAIKLPRLCADLIPRFPNETALVIALSSEPTHYFCELVKQLRSRLHTGNRYFLEPLARRLKIEQVDFVPSNQLAVALLEFASFASYTNNKQAVLEEEIGLGILDFLDLEVVNICLATAFVSAKFASQSDGAIRVHFGGGPAHGRTFKFHPRIVDTF